MIEIKVSELDADRIVVECQCEYKGTLKTLIEIQYRIMHELKRLNKDTFRMALDDIISEEVEDLKNELGEHLRK